MSLLLLLLAPALAAETEGFAELRGHGYVGVEGEKILFVERFRPTFDAELSERFALSSTIELNLQQGRRLEEELERTLGDSDFGPLLETLGCTWIRNENEVLDIDEAGDYLYVDRLYFDAYLPSMDIRMGRQAIQWGSAFLVNPTDPFPQVIGTNPWLPRAGVNSARVTVPLGDALRVQAVAGSDDLLQNLRASGRATVNLLETDFSLVGAWRQEAEDGLVGLDIKGTLGVGFWLEGAWHLRKNQDYEELALGVDYSFPVLDRLILTAQYYRNGNGSVKYDPTAVGGQLAGSATGLDCSCVDPAIQEQFGGEVEDPDPFGPYFSGRDYLMGSVAVGVSPDLSLSGLWVQNLGDGSAFALPVVSTFPTGWLEISAAAQLPVKTWGEGGELSPADNDLSFSPPVGDPIDLSGLVPEATFILWTRASF